MSTPTDGDRSTGDEETESVQGRESDAEADAEEEYTDLPAATREREQEEEFPPEFGGGTKDYLGFSDSLDVAGNHP